MKLELLTIHHSESLKILEEIRLLRLEKGSIIDSLNGTGGQFPDLKKEWELDLKIIKKKIEDKEEEYYKLNPKNHENNSGNIRENIRTK